MAYNQQVAQQQALLNQQNFGITPGYQALAVDGRLGPLTQSALAQYGTPQSLTMVNGAPVIPTNALNQNGAMPNMPSVNPNMTPQQFVAGLTPLTPVQTQSASPISVSGNTANVNALEKGQSSLVKRLGAAQQQLLGQGQEQLALEQQAGIPQSVKDIAALTDQINAKQAAFNNTEEIYRNGAISSQAIATGRVQRLQQAAAVELGGLSAMLLGKQGNMEAAKAQVDRTLKLEFDPIKQEIENTKTFLELNYKDLDRADKKQADALRVQLSREERAANAFETRKNMLLKAALDSGSTDSYQSILGASSSGQLAKAVANMKSQETGVPADIAEKIGESKVGQKVNATIDFSNSLNAYKTMYKKYADSNNLLSFEAQRNLATLKGDLEQKYSAANGQGAVQTGDRESYNKIIRGGILLPKQTLGSLDTLINSLSGTIANDTKYLNQTYGNYADSFFAPQLQKAAEASVDPQTKLKSLYSDPDFSSLIDNAVAKFPTYSPADILQIIGQ